MATVEPISPRRKWTAIAVATLLLMVSYYGIVSAYVVSGFDELENAPDPGPILAFGLALAPFVFILLAFLSVHRKAAGASMLGLLVGLLVAIPAAVFAQDIVSALVAGFGTGGIVALRRDEDHGWVGRLAAVFVAYAFTLVMLRVNVAFTIQMAPLLPFPALGLADAYMEAAAATRPPTD